MGSEGRRPINSRCSTSTASVPPGPRSRRGRCRRNTSRAKSSVTGSPARHPSLRAVATYRPMVLRECPVARSTADFDSPRPTRSRTFKISHMATSLYATAATSQQARLRSR